MARQLYCFVLCTNPIGHLKQAKWKWCTLITTWGVVTIVGLMKCMLLKLLEDDKADCDLDGKTLEMTDTYRQLWKQSIIYRKHCYSIRRQLLLLMITMIIMEVVVMKLSGMSLHQQNTNEWLTFDQCKIRQTFPHLRQYQSKQISRCLHHETRI